MAADMDGITRHESALTAYALDRLRSLPAVTVYGPNDSGGDTVGVIAFNLRGVPHALVAAILAYEAGIGVRNGCFCAQQYVMRLLKIAPSDQARRHREYLAGNRSQKPGMVRISLGAYNVRGDIDDLIAMLQRIEQNQYEGRYIEVTEHGNYRAAGDAGALVRCV
jgi:selenocysteine lyase/cysteine desulfurase